MTPLLFSLHLSVARVTTSYYQLPLATLTDDAPRGVHADERYYLPEKDTMNGGAENSVDFYKRENPCVQKWVLKFCEGKTYRVAVCYSSSLTACHSAIPIHGTRKCKVTQYTFNTHIPNCGPYPTDCGCDSWMSIAVSGLMQTKQLLYVMKYMMYYAFGNWILEHCQITSVYDIWFERSTETDQLTI